MGCDATHLQVVRNIFELTTNNLLFLKYSQENRRECKKCTQSMSIHIFTCESAAVKTPTIETYPKSEQDLSKAFKWFCFDIQLIDLPFCKTILSILNCI